MRGVAYVAPLFFDYIWYMERGWENIKYEDEGELHTLPLNDNYDHQHTICCDCNPRIERVNGWIIICHNSFDGREAVEWAEEIINGG